MFPLAFTGEKLIDVLAIVILIFSIINVVLIGLHIKLTLDNKFIKR